MSVVSLLSVLLVEETGVSGENHWPVASHWQTYSGFALDRFQGSSWSHSIWIYSYLCNQCLSPLKLWFWTLFMARCTQYNNIIFSSNNPIITFNRNKPIEFCTWNRFVINKLFIFKKLVNAENRNICVYILHS
jgi:hypothetical protein